MIKQLARIHMLGSCLLDEFFLEFTNTHRYLKKVLYRYQVHASLLTERSARLTEHSAVLSGTFVSADGASARLTGALFRADGGFRKVDGTFSSA